MNTWTHFVMPFLAGYGTFHLVRQLWIIIRLTLETDK